MLKLSTPGWYYILRTVEDARKKQRCSYISHVFPKYSSNRILIVVIGHLEDVPRSAKDRLVSCLWQGCQVEHDRHVLSDTFVLSESHASEPQPLHNVSISFEVP